MPNAGVLTCASCGEPLPIPGEPFAELCKACNDVATSKVPRHVIARAAARGEARRRRRAATQPGHCLYCGRGLQGDALAAHLKTVHAAAVVVTSTSSGTRLWP